MREEEKIRKEKEKEKMMRMEDYFDFFKSRNINFATIPFLNQIIHMHGFRKLHRSKTKKTIGDAVNRLDLIDLSRSTLKQSINVSSTVTLEEVIVDIEALKWEECSITSIQTLNAAAIVEPKQKNKSKKRKRILSVKRLLKSG